MSPPLDDRALKSKAMAIEPKKVIDVDMDEDCNDEVFVEGKVDSDKKRKGTMAISLAPCSVAQSDSVDKVHSTKKVESNKGKDVVAIMPLKPGSVSQQNSVGSDSFTTDMYADGYVSEDDYEKLQSCFDNIDLPSGIEAPLPLLLDTVKLKNRASTNQLVTSLTQLEVSHPHSVDPLLASACLSRKKKNPAVEGGSSYSSLQAESNPKNVTSVETPHKIQHQTMPSSTDIYPTYDMLMEQDAGNCRTSSSARLDYEDVLKRYESFKKFDTVQDHSDHYYSTQNPAMKQPPKNWVKKILEEWRILENDLPDTIFVRVYESRMDLLRAVIIGAEGTPYHDGLFFFDVCFPSSYPDAPPLVHYHSGGLRINPILYSSGKVCLSLLSTWLGFRNENWVTGNSTMLQVLVSIQGLVLNAKPYFNEPEFFSLNGPVLGEQFSLAYNENTLILSLKTMVYIMKKPPKNFEDLVIGHFRNCVCDILMACKAYMEGVHVGCFVRGGVQDTGNSCSPKFKKDVASYIKILVSSFKEIGAKEAEEFLHLSELISLIGGGCMVEDVGNSVIGG